MDFMQSRREERMKAYISGAELDVRTYNLIMGATVVYGLVMNVLACIFLTDFALASIRSDSWSVILPSALRAR